MKVEVTQPLWLHNLHKENYAALAENLTTDVCIVGGGIAGLSIAYQLLLANKSVIVIESQKIGSGESGNTSAHLSNALDDRFYRIAKMHGQKKARLAAKSHTEAIDEIEKTIARERIHCDFKRIPGYLFDSDAKEDSLQKEHEAARAVGLDVQFIEQEYVGKALVFPEQARFQPEQYLQGLATVIVKLGGKIYEHSTAADIDFKKHVVTLKNKKKINADYIVIATNAPKFGQLKFHFKVNPQRTYLIGIKIPKNSIQDALYWDTNDPYHYVRIESYNKDFDILLVGGEDHRVGTEPKENPFQRLQQWAGKQFQLDRANVVYQWSGQVLEPIDYMAYIGRHPKDRTSFMVFGDSGNGLTHGALAGLLITGLIVNGTHSYEKLYRIKRLPWRAIKNLSKNALDSMLGYIKYSFPQWGKKIPIGEGKIIQAGFKKVAIYHEGKNKFRKCSGICPHMGAVLSWNSIEKTWDCPAHGSRFDVNGKMLNGPTNQALPCKNKNSH